MNTREKLQKHVKIINKEHGWGGDTLTVGDQYLKMNKYFEHLTDEECETVAEILKLDESIALEQQRSAQNRENLRKASEAQRVSARFKIQKYASVKRSEDGSHDILTFGHEVIALERPLNEMTEEELIDAMKDFDFDGFLRMRRAKKKEVHFKNPCECGCGGMASGRSRFLPGHDSKLKSRLRKAVEEGNDEALEELLDRNWV